MIPPPLPPDETRRLQAQRRLGLLDTPAEERFDRIVRMAARTFRVPISLVSLVDGSRQWFKARVGLDAASTARSISFCGHAILTPDTFVVRNALDDQRFADNPLVTSEPHVRFYAGHPLHAPDGSPVGTLCLLDRRARDFSPEERQQLEDLASWVELELNALTLQEARTALAQQERFFELSVDMLCLAGLDGTFRQLSQAWTRTLGHSEPTLRATPLLELVHEEDRASTAEWLARGARGELLPCFEHRCRGQDGAWHWLQWNATVNPEEGILYGVEWHAEAGTHAAPVPQPVEPASEPTPRAVRPRVLHVEADADNRRVVADVLRGVADVVSVSSPQEAESALRSGPFPLVIAEPVLPDGGLRPLAPLLAAAPVVLFSVREAEPERAPRLSAVLVKSRASNEELRSAVLRLLHSAAHSPPPRGSP